MLPDKWIILSAVAIAPDEDKEVDESILCERGRYWKFLVPDILPLKKGFVSKCTKTQPYNIKGTKHISQVAGTVKTSDTITADFFGDPVGFGVPDIVPGERCILYHYKGDDKFFWLPYMRDKHLRLQELVRFYAVNKEHNNPATTLDVWGLEIDSLEKRHIRIMTNKGTGEKHVYTWAILPDEERFILMDDAGNFFELDSKNTVLTLQNEDETFMKLTKKDIETYSPGDTKAIIDRDLTVDVKRNVIINVEGNVLANVIGDAFVNTRTLTSISSGQAIIKGSPVLIN